MPELERKDVDVQDVERVPTTAKFVHVKARFAGKYNCLMYHNSSHVVARGFLTVEQLTELGSMTTVSVFITTSPLPAAQLRSPRTGRGKHMTKVTAAVTNLREVWRKRKQGGLDTTPGSDDWGILRIARITGSTVSGALKETPPKSLLKQVFGITKGPA